MNEDENDMVRYIDGEMEDDERMAFEQRLHDMPDLARRMEIWRRNDSTVAAALADDLSVPMPAATLALLQMPEARTTAAVVSIDSARAARKAERDIRLGWRWPAGIAVAVAASALFVVGTTLNGGGATLATALDKARTGETIAIEARERVTPVATFAAADGRWCREFRIAAAKGNRTGVACRSRGRWSTEVMVASNKPVDAGDDYQTAAGDQLPALDRVYRRLGAADSLSPDDERALIDSGWRTKTR